MSVDELGQQENSQSFTGLACVGQATKPWPASIEGRTRAQYSQQLLEQQYLGKLLQGSCWLLYCRSELCQGCKQGACSLSALRLQLGPSTMDGHRAGRSKLTYQNQSGHDTFKLHAVKSADCIRLRTKLVFVNMQVVSRMDRDICELQLPSSARQARSRHLHSGPWRRSSFPGSALDVPRLDTFTSRWSGTFSIWMNSLLRCSLRNFANLTCGGC